MSQQLFCEEPLKNQQLFKTNINDISCHGNSKGFSTMSVTVGTYSANSFVLSHILLNILQLTGDCRDKKVSQDDSKLASTVTHKTCSLPIA
jgi:hypothetical protein